MAEISLYCPWPFALSTQYKYSATHWRLLVCKSRNTSEIAYAAAMASKLKEVRMQKDVYFSLHPVLQLEEKNTYFNVNHIFATKRMYPVLESYVVYLKSWLHLTAKLIVAKKGEECGVWHEKKARVCYAKKMECVIH